MTALVLSQAAAAGDHQRYHHYDTCPLENGDVIVDCRIGYRTYGELNRDRSNVVLFPTWFTGTSKDVHDFGYVGPDAMIDSTRYFVIVVDAFANGVSSSPSNSMQQPDLSFPAVTIADMTVMQRRLLKDVFDLERVHAVAGISMGGMQALEWAVRYPDFMDKAVSIVGTPVQTAYDLLLWETQLETITELGETATADRIVAGIETLTLYTPQHVVTTTKAADYASYITAAIDGVAASHLLDRVPQLRAMIEHDVSRPYEQSLAAAAARVRAELLIMVSPGDHMVNAAPSRHFAELTGARFHELPGDCGHLAVVCQRESLQDTVRSFLRD